MTTFTPNSRADVMVIRYKSPVSGATRRLFFTRFQNKFTSGVSAPLYATTLDAIAVEFELVTGLIPTAIVYNPSWFPES